MPTDIERADTLTRRRAIAMPFAGVAFLAYQGVFFGWSWTDPGLVQTLLWAVLAVGLTAFLLTGGGWTSSPAVRRLANDESTRHNRAMALRGAFLASAITAVIVFVVAPFEPLSAQRAAHLILSIGLAVGLVSFGIEEMRSYD